MFAAALLWLAAIAEAQAAAGPWVDHGESRLRLIAAGDTAGDGESVSLGLHFKLAPEWKIYWRSPGDAGFPPQLDWSASNNLADTAIAWPVPHRFSLFGLETFGYSDEVVLPISGRILRPGEALSLRARVDYLVCEEICIPQRADLALDLPAGAMRPSRHALLIDQYRSLVPGDGAEVGLGLEEAVLSGPAEAPILRVTVRSSVAFTAPDLLIEAPPGFVFGKPEVDLGEDGRRAVLVAEGVRGAQAEGVLEGKRVTLTVTDGRRGLEREIVARLAPEAIPPRPASPMAPVSLLTALALGVVGGLILNLMPCVLPVLSIKLLSVVGAGGRDRREVRAGFLMTAAGILFSFLLLAGLAVALKSAGLAAGWGIQFQQPAFLAFMALVVTFFALNLFGLFEIALPSRLLDAAATRGQGEKLLGHFATGAFATLLATPCSAPFVGTAVGFALSQGTVEILLVFVSLGLGLAVPYLAVAAAPGLATRLPRPGGWMITLRRIMGLALAGTAVWLLTVLAAQIGWVSASLVGATLIALGLLIAFRARLPLRGAVAALGLALAVIAVALPATVATRAASQSAATADTWEPFDPARIDALVAAGKVVFVDITADWCVTCQVNKALVVERQPVAGALAEDAIVTMRGDWTVPSEEISSYLAGFNRYGIPFNAVYGPGAPTGEPLSEILTPDAVLAALARAGGRTVASREAE